jgi:hypothetical protein
VSDKPPDWRATMRAVERLCRRKMTKKERLLLMARLTEVKEKVLARMDEHRRDEEQR